MTSTLHKGEDFEKMRRMEEEYEKGNPAYFIQILRTEKLMVLRLHAITALANIGDETAVPALAEVLKNDSDPLLRHEAAFSLGQMGIQPGIPHLIDATLHDPSDIVRHEAAAALGSIGNQTAREALTQALDDPSPLVSGSAKASLYNLNYLKSQMRESSNSGRNQIRP